MSGAESVRALNDLASARFGASVLFATDEWFASADNLLSSHDPVWNEDFTPYGKWMDGWESGRKRVAGHDYSIIQLGHPCLIEAIEFDTCHFVGNFTPSVSVQALHAGPGHPAKGTLDAMRALRDEERSWRPDGFAGTRASEEATHLCAKLESQKWETIVKKTELKAGTPKTRFTIVKVSGSKPVSHIRLNMYPDGGIARLRVYGRISRDWTKVSPSETIDLAAAMNGGEVVSWSDAHFGHPRNMIGPGRAPNMGDGWETARKTGRPGIIKADAKGQLMFPGDDWAMFKLACVGTITEILIDTNHFKGNYPESCKIEGTLVEAGKLPDGGVWREILPRTPLKPHKEAKFKPKSMGPFSHFRVTIFPDGGISRIRLLGNVAITPRAKL